MQCQMMGSCNVDWGIVGGLCVKMNKNVGVTGWVRATSLH